MHGKYKPDIHQEIKAVLASKERFGVSKHADKIDGTAKDGIYSYDTAKTYNRVAHEFGGYVSQQSPQGRHTPLRDCLPYAKDYIGQRSQDPNLSPYTVKMERSALAKLLGVPGCELGEVRERKREDITRSRNRYVTSEKTGKQILNPSSRAGHFSEKKHPDLVAFAKGTGLRASELASVRGDQLRAHSDGTYTLEMHGPQCKGGRPRELEVVGDVQRIAQLAQAAGSERIFQEIPRMDEHYYRRVYANEVYNKYARPVDQIPKEDRYICRGDKYGIVYDKAAMRIVSEDLGHSRIDVIAQHYLD